MIAGGEAHTCARNSAGAVACWGSNSNGQLGNGEGGTNAYKNTPVAVLALTNAVAIATGNYHTCAVLSTGEAKCWGKNDIGQLGDNSTTDRHTPVAVSALTDAVAIAAGAYHTCALLSTGGAKCWGFNNLGQLGNGEGGPNTDKTTPVTVLALTDAVALAAGNSHTCALLGNGRVKCWGYNNYGQLGDGATNDQSNNNTARAVLGIDKAVAITTGHSHTCAVLKNGEVKCWGATSFNYGNTPVAVLELTGAVAIAAGDGHTCAVLNTGGAKCWGVDSNGQLGDGGSNTNQNTPVDVLDLTGTVAIASGNYHTCALLSNGRVKCWGRNNGGQLGDGTFNANQDTPVDVLKFDACFQTITAPFSSPSPGIHLKGCEITL